MRPSPAIHSSRSEDFALFEILAQISRVALESDDLFHLMQSTVDFIAETLEVAIASILLLDEEEEHFVVEAYAGALELRLPAGESWPVSIGACGRAVQTGRPQHLEDVRADPDYVVGNEAVRSEYIVPIRYRDRTLGVLNLESTRHDTFSEQARRVFDAIADQVAGAIHLADVNRRLERANRELQRLSLQDPLTGVANRRGFDEALAMEWEHAARAGAPVSVLFADLDCFKALNDAHGHLYGDDCLRRVAQRLHSLVRRAGDLVARYGGEEFGVILGATPSAEAEAFAERMRRAIQRLQIDNRASSVAEVLTLTVGVATAEPDATTGAERLVEEADRALYLGKKAGRNRVVVAPRSS
ncbi:MAG: sensor domain-containing diguanylate cyclase [Thermoanaerobaculia bacterium]